MAQAIVYTNGFETGDGGQLVSLVGSIQTGTVRTGGYALKADNGGPNQLNSGMAATQSVTCAYLRVPRIPATSGNVIDFLYEEGVTPTQRATLRFQETGGLRLIDPSGTLGLTATLGTAVLAINTWYRIEMAIDLAAGGAIKVWVDGVLDINVTHTANVSGTPTDNICLLGDTSGNEYVFDDVVIATGGLTPIGAQQIIARQGVAGTPTYNAWTKTGAATAALCWSTTPFATAANCNSSTSGAAQTMNIGAFSAAGSASEGAQTVGASDTVNACTTVVVAKRATSGSPKIRRRVNGTDTDTTKVMTTADVLYTDGIWTTTVANLDLLEAGGVKAADGNLTTFEDVWVMCCYTPVAATNYAPFMRRRSPNSMPHLRR